MGLSLEIYSLFTNPKGLTSSHKFNNLEHIPHKPPKRLSLASVLSQYIKAISKTLSLLMYICYLIKNCLICAAGGTS